MGELLKTRREGSSSRFAKLEANLDAAKKLAADKACVYATGSFGRNEASSHSDVDLFIVGGTDDKEARTLSGLDEICLKAELIEATRNLQIPDFSGDGEYLIHYTIGELVKTLGKPDDDASNTFTARLLLILESRPLVGSKFYDSVIDKVISPYWGDYGDRKNEFIPAFLTNDILRLWRTFCVNYEARTEREPIARKAKRKLKNYKLKHSRLLTCYSALLYLLAVYGKSKTVSPTDAVQMIRMTPTERLEWLLQQPHLASAHSTVNGLISGYEKFLSQTDAPEKELIEKFMDPATSKTYFSEASDFGALMFAAIEGIGARSKLHQVLVV